MIEKTGYKEPPSLRCRMKEHLGREYNLSEKQVEAMVEIGCNDIKKNLRKITACVEDNRSALDYEVLRKAAHSLKGVLLNLGLKEKAETARKIEDAAQNGEKVDLVEKILALENEL